MPQIQRTLIDEYGRPIAGATVTVRDGGGALVSLDGGATANPTTTDDDGGIDITVASDGSYDLTYQVGTATKTVTVQTAANQGYGTRITPI